MAEAAQAYHHHTTSLKAFIRQQSSSGCGLRSGTGVAVTKKGRGSVVMPKPRPLVTGHGHHTTPPDDLPT
jgi:hypothetical protein